MPVINITLSDEEHRLLTDEYKRMSIDWLQTESVSVPPSFDQWLVARTVNAVSKAAMDEQDADEIRAVNAVEKLIMNLQPHGFALAYVGRRGVTLPDSANALGLAIAQDLQWAPSRARRMQELFEYYSRSSKEVADAGHVAVTKRAYGALHEAYRELIERTEHSLDRMSEEKAVARIEGASAILVGMQVLSRQSAQEKTEEFKSRIHKK